MPKRLASVTTHPIQYYAPWFRYLTQFYELDVLYLYCQDAQGQSKAGFGVQFEWDIPLLEGYSYRWLNNVSPHPGLKSFNGCDTPEIYEIIKNNQYDACLIFGWNYKSSWQAIHACWQNNVPVLMRGDSQLTTKRSFVKLAIKYIPYRLALPRFAGHLYVGQANKTYLKHYGIPKSKLFFAPHFVNNNFFQTAVKKIEVSKAHIQLRQKLDIDDDSFIFLLVGKFINKKRPADFIKALKIVHNTVRISIDAILVGDGPLRQDLEALALSYHLPIHFAGFCNQAYLPTFYRAADVLVLPSDSEETWGLVVNEAMACGLPCIVSNACGCYLDMIDEGKTGYTYPVGNVALLAEKMIQIVETLKNQKEQIRANIVEKIKTYSMERATQGLEEALTSVS